MKQLLPILLLILLLAPGVSAQRSGSAPFDGIKCEGPIPNDLKQSLDELYTQDKQRVRDYNDGKLANRDNVLFASYQINQLMASGRILYGDPITRMVERIADTLLKGYPELRKELRFYTVKSPEVNAFATGQGMIFVNIGLVAQAENEAQLAFIIGHEIIHYYKKHNLEVLSRKRSRVNSDDVEEQQLHDFLKYHNRSHEMENEADSLSLEMLYIDSRYDKDVADGVFDVLQYGYLPFDEVPFDTNYFTTPYYHLPAGRYLAQVAPITARDDYDDSHSSHPNILKRRARTNSVLLRFHGGEKYIVTTPQQFADIQRLARFECIRQNLIYADYVRAFYDSYVLSRQYPDDAFLTTARAQALYALSRCRTYTNTSVAVGDYKDYEGEIQQLYYLCGKLQADELALMALREVWNAHLRYPDDARLVTMAEELAADIQQQHGMPASAFSADFNINANVNENTDTVAPGSRNQKYDRIKQKRRSQQTNDPRRYVFTDFMMSDDSFAQMLRRAVEPRAEAAVKPRKNAFLFSPSYYVVDKNDGDIKFRKSDRLESGLADQVADVMEAKGLGTVALTDKSLRDKHTADEYNEYMLFNEWCNEFWQTKGEYGISLFTQPGMNGLIDKYDANLLNITFALNAEYYFRAPSLFSALYSIILVPAIPIGIYRLASNREATNVTTLMVDAAHGRLLNKKSYDIQHRDSRAVVKQAVYDNLNQSFAKMQGREDKPVSGYMGRRLAITVNGATTLNRTGFNAESNSTFFGLGDSAKVRPALFFGAEYAFASNQSIALTYRHNKVLTGQRCFTGMEKWGARYDRCPLDETTHNIVVSYRRYYDDAAPLGTYWGVGLAYSILNLDTAGAPGPLLLNSEKSRLPMHRFGVQLEFGRNYIYFDRLLLNIGVRYALMIANPRSEKIGFGDYDPDIVELHRLNADLMVNNCFMLSVGLGVVPF